MSLRLVRRPKSPHWIIRGTVRGIRVEESSGTGDKRVAEEIRAKREAQILAESVYGRRAANRSNVLERGVRFDCTIGLWALFWKGDVSFDPHSSDRGRHNAAGLGLVTLKRGFRVKTAVVLTDKGRAVAAQVVGRLRDTRAHKKTPQPIATSSERRLPTATLPGVASRPFSESNVSLSSANCAESNAGLPYDAFISSVA